MKIIFVNGGGHSPYDTIASSYGWKLGINSSKSPKSGCPLYFIDNDWRSWNFLNHLSKVREHRPHIASLKDIERGDNQALLYEEALQLARYCDRLMIIPKTIIYESRLLRIPNILIGLPVGPHENTISWEYAHTSGHQVHLLGGSPKKWDLALDRLGVDKVYSCDGNYLSRIAGYGKVYSDYRSRKPLPYEVPDGSDFNYRCFDWTLERLPSPSSRNQLSLFRL